MSVCPSVCSSFDFNEIWHVGRGRWVMHDVMQYDLIQGQGQGHEPFKVGNLDIFKSYLLRHLQWGLAIDHWFWNYGTVSKFDQPGFFIFGLIFVSRDFDFGKNVTCEESTVSSVRCYFILNWWSVCWCAECVQRTGWHDERSWIRNNTDGHDSCVEFLESLGRIQRRCQRCKTGPDL